MKTKEEILNKVSEIIDTSKDEQIILNACHFLHGVLSAQEIQEKLDKEKEEARQKSLKLNTPIVEMMKNMMEV